MSVPSFVGLIAIPLLGSPLIYLLGRLTGRRGPRSAAGWFAVVVLAVTWIPFLQAVPAVAEGKTLTFTLGSLTLALDGLGLLLAAVALGLGLLVALYSGPYLGAESGGEKFFAMLVAMVGVMVGLGLATDLFNLWIWFEAMAVCSYLLVAFYREQPASLEAGIKYLVQSAAGSTLVLVGIGLVLAERGTLDLAELRAAGSSGTLLAAGALFLIGFGVKAALVPLHTWLPDAHSQAPSGISAMLSGVVIEAGLVAMLRSIGALAGVTTLWGPMLLAFGVVNMVLGNLMALRQVQVKRLLAYSSLAHMGYMLVGLGLFVTAGEASGAQGGLFHLFNHGLMKGLAFLAAGSLLFTLHLARGDHAPLTVEDLSGAARRYPLVALTLSLAVLGLGGLPPLAGFMSKWQIFVAGFETAAPWAGWLVAFAALNSVLSLAYYAPLVNAMYRREPSPAVQAGARLPVAMGLPLIVLSAGVVAIGLWPSLMTWLTAPASRALALTFGG
jgi:proton-translocating NADH-quinone oxidoreductase chain N